MEIRPIKTEEDYRANLREIESLMGAEPNTSEGERLDVLVTLVEAYVPLQQEKLSPEERATAFEAWALSHLYTQS